MNRQRTSIVWKDCDAINNTEGLMSGRYSTYSKLKIAYPHQRVLRITFDRPETYNSVDAETHTELTHIWRDINEDSDIGAVIVTGAGKAFSAGGDFEMIKQIIASPAARMTRGKEAKDLVYNVINCNKPIISAINGVAVGALLGNDADTALAGHASDSQAYCARGCRGCSSIERLERLGLGD